MSFLTYLITVLISEIFIFLAVFAESIPFIGALVPGGVIIVFLAGGFAKAGYLPIITTFVVCFFASFTIDLFGYWVGKVRGEKILHKYSKYVLVKKDFLHRIADLLREHPTKLLIGGKFNPATRSIAPFMAGLKYLEFKKFVTISIISSLLWVSVFYLLGMLVGKGLTTAKLLGKWAVIITFIIFLILYLVYLIRQLIKKRRMKRYGNYKQI
jgi:membrane-associated protein